MTGLLPSPFADLLKSLRPVNQLASVGLLDAHCDDLPQLIELQLSELVPLFQKSKSLAHDFACREIPTALDFPVNELL
jgi:hypothetical protein